MSGNRQRQWGKNLNAGVSEQVQSPSDPDTTSVPSSPGLQADITPSKEDDHAPDDLAQVVEHLASVPANLRYLGSGVSCGVSREVETN